MSLGNVSTNAVSVGGRMVMAAAGCAAKGLHEAHKASQGQKFDQQPQHVQNAIQYQASLAVRVQQINATIGELQPRSAALKDPEARAEVELRLKGLARQGQFITEASRQLEEILTERGRAW